MFKFLHRFSNSPSESRFERTFARKFFRPELEISARENLKKRILNRISAEKIENNSAEILDKKLAGEKIPALGWLDRLAALAEMLLDLPRVRPRRNWRESTRENFEPGDRRHFFGILRQATAFALLLVVGGGVILTSFVSQTRTAVAQLSVESGIVKIRTAESPFFEKIQKSATIRLGDTVRVENNSTAALNFFDASKMRVTENSEIAITEFSPDFISRENSAVKVAVLAGSVETIVAKEAGNSFEVETSTGSVEAQNATFSVAIDPTDGSTKIETTEEMVAVRSLESSTAVALTAGESVVFAEAEIVALAEISPEIIPEFVPPAIADVRTKSEFIKIRFFDSLIAAEDEDIELAKKIRTDAKTTIAELAESFGVVDGDLDALALFVRKNYSDDELRSQILADIGQATTLGEILNYYFLAPRKLRGVPEFEILARDGYFPLARVRNLVAVLRAGELAHIEVRPLAADLIAEFIVDLSTDLSAQKALDFIATTKNQPIFLPVLRGLLSNADESTTIILQNTIAEMEATISEYLGN